MILLFVADLHLHPECPELTEGFLAYLEDTAQGSDALYILGDLFDAWIGDDILDLAGLDPSGAADIAVRISTALKELSDTGTQIYLMHGNRDFLLGERFAKSCGASLLGDTHLIEHASERILMMHGDTLCTRDEAYQAFRAQARDPQWQDQVLAMPIEQRVELAKSLRLKSGEAMSNKAQDIMDVTPDEVVRVMSEQGATTLIHGHTHRPAEHVLKVDGHPGKRYVLGDWQPNRGWEVRIEAGQPPQLREFPLA